MTPRQQVMKYLLRHVNARGEMPSMATCIRDTGFDRVVVRECLILLAFDGCIETKERHKVRIVRAPKPEFIDRVMEVLG